MTTVAGGDGVASPCVGVCALDSAGTLCLGCLRTLDEITRWGSMSVAERHGVLARLRADERADPR